MSTESTPTKAEILITIIGEFVLKDRIVKLLKSKDVTGYTISEVRGEGGHGRRMGDIAGYNTNVEIKTVVSSEISDDIFHALAELRNGHALVAFRHKVETLSD
jgi:nitrogen regulatory protein PII